MSDLRARTLTRTSPALEPDETWRLIAACRTEDPELFFPTGLRSVTRPQTRAAKSVCARCPVRAECLAEALENEEPFGIFGGKTPEERQRIKPHVNRKPAPIERPSCGTDSGYKLHMRHGERTCDRCRVAHAQVRAEARKEAS